MTPEPGRTRPINCPRTTATSGSTPGTCDSGPGCGCERPRRKAPAVTATAVLRDDVHADMIVQVLLAIAAEQPGTASRRRVPRQRAA